MFAKPLTTNAKATFSKQRKQTSQAARSGMSLPNTRTKFTGIWTLQYSIGFQVQRQEESDRFRTNSANASASFDKCRTHIQRPHEDAGMCRRECLRPLEKSMFKKGQSTNAKAKRKSIVVTRHLIQYFNDSLPCSIQQTQKPHSAYAHMLTFHVQTGFLRPERLCPNPRNSQQRFKC